MALSCISSDLPSFPICSDPFGDLTAPFVSDLLGRGFVISVVNLARPELCEPPTVDGTSEQNTEKWQIPEMSRSLLLSLSVSALDLAWSAYIRLLISGAGFGLARVRASASSRLSLRVLS
jgi:hypothetical protein